MTILKQGLKGAPVRRLQERLGIAADGSYGERTRDAVHDWQAGNGLDADGIAGPDTFAAMGLNELVLLREGSKGALVREMQGALGVEPDGLFGMKTRQAVVDFQRGHGLETDGMAGPRTLSLMALDGFSDAAIARSRLRTDEEPMEGDALPYQSATSTIDDAEPAPDRSVWGRLKGWFG